jgi:peptide/nickel transport system substrate-binding protein
MHKINARRSSEEQLIAASCAQAGMSIIDDGDEKWSTRLGAGQYDTVVFAWQGSPLVTPNIPIYKTPPDKTNLLSNSQYYSNPQVDALMETVATATEPQKVADVLNQVDVIMWQDLNSIPLFQFPDILSFSDKVSNVIYNPSQQGPTWNIQLWATAA